MVKKETLRKIVWKVASFLFFSAIILSVGGSVINILTKGRFFPSASGVTTPERAADHVFDIIMETKGEDVCDLFARDSNEARLDIRQPCYIMVSPPEGVSLETYGEQCIQIIEDRCKNN